MKDTIYRQNTIDAISTWDKFGIDERNRIVRWHEGLEPYVKLRDVVWAIEKIPSAQQNGRWIDYGYNSHTCVCSCCGIRQDIVAKFLFSFCPNCGADMRGENDDKRTV